MFSLNPATLIFDFRFDIADALMQTDALNHSVSQISDSAMRAEQSIISLGASVLTSLGTVPGTIAGMFGAAVQASEKFEQSTLSWANLISANKDVLSGPIGTHEQRLVAARSIMLDIARISREFGLPQKDLSDFSKMINANLTRKGLQGTNFEVGTNMARQLLKSAPNLGIDPMLSMGQLVRAIQGGANMGDPLFRSLTSDTTAMHRFSRAGGTELFNALPAAQRVKLLNEALGQFAKDSSVNEARFRSMTGQLQVLKDTMIGFDGVLRPLGDRVKKLILEALVFINESLTTEGRKIVANFNKIFSMVAGSSQQAIVNLTQAQRLEKTLQVGKSAVTFLAHMALISEGLKLIAHFTGAEVGAMRLIGAALGAFGASLRVAWSFIGPILGMMARFVAPLIMPIISVIVSQILLPLVVLMGALSTLDRAVGYARVADLKAMPKVLAELSGWGARFALAWEGILLPFTTGMDIIAKALAPLFQFTTWMDIIRTPVEWLLTALEAVAALMVHFTVSLETLGDRMGAWIFNTHDKHDDWGDVFNRLYEEKMNKLQERMDRGEITPKQEVNIGRVTIENKFQENMQPDRIAFTIKEQLVKLANNGTQAKGIPPIYPSYGR
jgi:hypothetical protein